MERPPCKVNQDILLEIFFFSSDTMHKPPKKHHHSALNVIWRCSHVCRLWRFTILRSTTLWGRLIDLEFMFRYQIKPIWREEILKRTGKAPLFIRGPVHGDNEIETDFIINILQLHWKRIQYLRINITKAGPLTFPSSTWELFRRPAELLESIVFDFRVDPSFSYIPSLVNEPLFGDHSPCLRRFEFFPLPSTFELTSPCFSQIRQLRVEKALCVTDWLCGLLCMPFIESLDILDGFEDTNSDVTLPVVHLGNLRRLTVKCSTGFIRCFIFLGQIHPHVDCKLNLQAHFSASDDLDLADSFNLGEDDMSMASKVLSRYATNRFNSPTASSALRLVFNSNSFLFTESLIEENFSVNISNFDEDSLPFLLSLLNSFTSFPLYSVTTIYFYTQSTRSEILSLPFYAKRFFLSLHSVTTLTTDLVGLMALFQARDVVQPCEVDFKYSHSPVFPSLRTIRLTDNSFPLTLRERTDFFIDFLKWRKQEMVSVRVVDLSLCVPSFMRRMDFLDSFAGLKVVWKDGQYICGSGNPDKLLFES